LVSVSTRGNVPAGGALTPGVVMQGTGSKQLLFRAVGPALANFGVPGVLSDPVLNVYPLGGGTLVASNDNWGASTGALALSAPVANLISASAAVGAFPLSPGSKDAAALVTLNLTSGGDAYTAVITPSVPGMSGVALGEVYDPEGPNAPVKIIGVSTLGYGGTGADVLIAGIEIGGPGPKLVLIRAVGPGLIGFGVPTPMVDPQFAVYPLGANFPVAANNDWGGTPALAAGFQLAHDFALQPTSKDAAAVVRLPPGGYTIVVSGADGGSGNVLVEVYDLDALP
jgi:hypothetical protein